MVTLLVLTLILVLILFSILAIVARKAQRSHRQDPNSSAPSGPAWLGRLIPTDPNQALVTAVMVSALMGIVLVFLAIYGVRQYAWGVFIVTPFAIGFVSAWLVSYHQQTTIGRCLLASSLTHHFSFLVPRSFFP